MMRRNNSLKWAAPKGWEGRGQGAAVIPVLLPLPQLCTYRLMLVTDEPQTSTVGLQHIISYLICDISGLILDGVMGSNDTPVALTSRGLISSPRAPARNGWNLRSGMKLKYPPTQRKSKISSLFFRKKCTSSDENAFRRVIVKTYGWANERRNIPVASAQCFGELADLLNWNI